MGDGLLHGFTGPFWRRSIGMDGGLARPVALEPIVHDVRQRVLAGEIKVERLRASGRAEYGAHTAAPDEAAAPNPSAQWALAVLAAAHMYSLLGRDDDADGWPSCALSRDRR